MKEHHTKNKGDLGVLKAQLDLYEQGCAILMPLTEHESFDLVAYKEGAFKRIQVKYRSLNAKGVLEATLASAWADKHGTHRTVVDRAQIDIYCVYCPETDECYYFDINQVGGTVSLRITPPKNNQTKNVRFAKNYRTIPTSPDSSAG